MAPARVFRGTKNTEYCRFNPWPRPKREGAVLDEQAWPVVAPTLSSGAADRACSIPGECGGGTRWGPGLGPEHRVPSEASILASPGFGPGPGVEGVVGLQFAVPVNPPLPRVEIIRAENEGARDTGQLMAHVDGFWHFFDESKMLRSIPDDKVMTVTVSKVSGS
jgi:hypothetical protein